VKLDDCSRVTAAARLGREALFAIRAVDEAVQLARSLQAHMPAAALTKADASPVTLTDFAIQTVIAARLSDDFPRDLVVASGTHLGLRSPEGSGAA
jgi:3'-phosphoadenosine 5'-phosphosulfate (PAPS) 3'-phosphatase